MIRRMEARISSIEGSCAFAGWLIPASPQPDPDDPCAAPTGIQPHAANHSRLLANYSDRPKYGTALHERKRCAVDRHVPERTSGCADYLPSGVRTPTQV